MLSFVEVFTFWKATLFNFNNSFYSNATACQTLIIIWIFGDFSCKTSHKMQSLGCNPDDYELTVYIQTKQHCLLPQPQINVSKNACYWLSRVSFLSFSIPKFNLKSAVLPFFLKIFSPFWTGNEILSKYDVLLKWCLLLPSNTMEIHNSLVIEKSKDFASFCLKKKGV